jgi:hypothetical protein
VMDGEPAICRYFRSHAPRVLIFAEDPHGWFERRV